MTEINVTDVMLGDWVLYEHKNSRGETISTHYLKVENITSRDIFMRNGDYARVQCVGYGCIKPIPLTEEILEKNGFEELMSEGWESAAKFGRIPEPTGVWQYSFGQFDSVSYLPKRSFLSVKFMEGYTADIANIKYVHELQHALRLCGVEKEIIL